MDDGNVALVVDFDLDSAIGVRPMIANLMIVSDNPAEEADSTIMIGINALNAKTKKEEVVVVSKGHESAQNIRRRSFKAIFWATRELKYSISLT